MEAKLYFGSTCKSTEVTKNVLSPYDGHVVSKVSLCDSNDALTMLLKAQEAFLHVKKIPLHQRINWLLDVAQKLENIREEMALIITEEVGKPIRFHAAKWIAVLRQFDYPRMPCNMLMGKRSIQQLCQAVKRVWRFINASLWALFSQLRRLIFL